MGPGEEPLNIRRSIFQLNSSRRFDRSKTTGRRPIKRKEEITRVGRTVIELHEVLYAPRAEVVLAGRALGRTGGVYGPPTMSADDH